MSGIALPDGVAPQPARNPERKFKKNMFDPRGGELVKPHLEFYNVEGEAVMRRRSMAEIVDIGRSVDLSALNAQILQETSDYKSWLCSNAGLCQESLENESLCWFRPLFRFQKRWKGNKVLSKTPVNKVLVCTLLEARFDNGTRVKADEWGNHSDTAEVYRARLQRSERERKGNTRDDGKLLSEVKSLPPDWISSMTSQRVLEGCENRSRPPTVTELVGKYHYRLPQAFRVGRKLQDPIKPEDNVEARTSTVPWNTQSVAVDKLSQYGTRASNDDCPNVHNAHVLSYVEYILSGDFHALGASEPKVRSRITSTLGEFESYEEEARYLSWLSCPEAMSLASYYDRDYFYEPSEEVTKSFNAEHPISEDQRFCDFFVNDSSESDRLALWLLGRSYTNYSARYPRKLKPLSHTWLSTLSVNNRRLAIKIHQWKAGLIPLEKEASYLASIEFHKKLDRQEREHASQGEGFVLINASSEGDWSKDVKRELTREASKPQAVSYRLLRLDPSSYRRFEAYRIGLDYQVPMTDMEYRNITRVEPNSVDKHVSNLVTDPSGPEIYTAYSPVAEAIAEKSYLRVRDQMSKPIIGSLELGDSYELDEEVGLLMPNSNSKDFARVLDQVSR